MVFVDPFEEIRRMQERLNRLFEEFSVMPELRETKLSMPVDVIDEGEQVRVIADIPGFRKEDIEVYFEDGDLVIKAERSEETEEKGRDYIRRERRMGKLYRRIPLPADVSTEGVKARYTNGVLEITVPRKRRDRRVVSIE